MPAEFAKNFSEDYICARWCQEGSRGKGQHKHVQHRPQCELEARLAELLHRGRFEQVHDIVATAEQRHEPPWREYSNEEECGAERDLDHVGDADTDERDKAPQCFKERRDGIARGRIRSLTHLARYFFLP
jgi:hypothetical protein